MIVPPRWTHYHSWLCRMATPPRSKSMERYTPYGEHIILRPLERTGDACPSERCTHAPSVHPTRHSHRLYGVGGAMSPPVKSRGRSPNAPQQGNLARSPRWHMLTAPIRAFSWRMSPSRRSGVTVSLHPQPFRLVDGLSTRSNRRA
jgi:hypothetical protein